MKNNTQTIGTVLFWILLFPAVNHAQAWTKNKGQGFYKLDVAGIVSDFRFNESGTVVSSPRLGTYTGSFYGEYGVTRKITVYGYAPLYVRNVLSPLTDPQTGQTTRPGFTTNNIGDIDLGIRWALPLKIKGWSAAANLTLGLPSGHAQQALSLKTGDGELNQMLKLSAGTSRKRWWTQFAVGFNNRTEKNSDEFRYDAEFGYSFFQRRLLAIFKVNGIESFHNGSAPVTSTGLFSNNVEYMGIGPEILYYANRKKSWGITARVAGASKGQNILASPAVSFGIFAER